VIIAVHYDTELDTMQSSDTSKNNTTIGHHFLY